MFYNNKIWIGDADGEKISILPKMANRHGLIAGATGTGKTYASAFAVRDDQPKRTLFLFHREQIAKQAMESYKRVIGSKNADGSLITYGLLSGNSKDYDSQFLFSTMQMMSKPEIYEYYDKEAFDIIVLVMFSPYIRFFLSS